MEVDILVLGPVELRVDGRREMYGAAKGVQLLAALALDAGRAVGLDELADRLWENAPPRKPHASLHVYATRIRRRIGSERLIQQAHAYTLAVEQDAVDVHRFDRLTTQAHSMVASGDDPQARKLVGQAEELWRGAPLTGVAGLWAEQVRQQQEDRLLATRLLRYSIDLRMGHFAEIVGELAVLTEQHPGDETIAGLYMAAAYGRGQAADALQRYETLRRRLRAVGTEPGPALSRMHARILAQAPVSELLPGRPPGDRRPVPHNLPTHGDLVGRATELAELGTPTSGVIAFQAISGMAGVGKSLLATHIARRLARHYPDGQLYVNLRAHSGREPLSPQSALGTLLRQLGVPASRLPPDTDDLSALWRTLLSSRRAIIVLDDAAGVEQLRPLLPGDSTSLVLVTSRRRLTALPGVRHVFLDVMPAADAEALFVARVGADRAGDPADVAALARLAGYLPLALELLAGRLRSRPAWSVAHLVQRMADNPGRLAEIRDGGQEVAAAFELSYEQLTTDQQRVFRLLSLHFAAGFGAHATAALADLPLSVAERVLEQLYDVYLLREPAPERFEAHDLLNLYARTRTLGQDTEAVRDAARDRLADFYLHAAAHADRLLFPRSRRLERPLPAASFAVPRWTGDQQARGWLAAETSALAAAARHYRDRGRPEQAAHLADRVAEFLDTEGHWTLAEELHTQAARHWHTAGEPAAEARALLALTAVQSHLGRYDDADRHGRRALEAARLAQDAGAEAEALRLLGLTAWDLGRLDESLALQRDALELQLRLGDPWYIARYRNNLGIALLHLGHYDRAEECFRAAHTEFVRIGYARGEGQALNNSADLLRRRGEMEAAHDAFSRSIELVERHGTRTEYAVTLMNMASTLDLPRNAERALELQRRALDTFRLIGSRREETVALVTIANVLHGAARFVEASAHHSAALRLAREIGAAQEEVQALRGLGLAELRSGRPAVAVGRLHEALALAQRINALEETARCHAALAETYAATGRAEESSEHSRLAQSHFKALDGEN